MQHIKKLKKRSVCRDIVIMDVTRLLFVSNDAQGCQHILEQCLPIRPDRVHCLNKHVFATVCPIDLLSFHPFLRHWLAKIRVGRNLLCVSTVS